jgi:glycosyltransferase involved in cell wall biosynthesis
VGRLRLAVWSPLPPSASGIADYVAEQLPELARRFDVTAVVEDPSAVDRAVAEQVALTTAQDMPAADLDVYHVGNSPPHAYVYRAALQRPGVLALHEWSVHHLVLRETVERGDRAAYLREMRRCHGEAGTFVGRQVARALGGDLLPALYAVNDRLLESSLAVVGLSRHVAERARLRLPGRPVLHLPHHLALPLAPLPSRAEARRTLGLPAGAAIVTAPGLATASKRLDVAVQAVARLRASRPDLRLVVAGAVEERLPLAEWAAGSGLGEGLLVTGRLSLDDFVRHLVAADVVLALRFPSHGEISGAMVRSLGVGRPVLVTAGTPGAEEFPEGVVVPVDPGPQEAQQLEALLGHLLEAHGLRESIGRLARGHIAEHHDLSRTTAQLAAFFDDVHQRLESLRRLVPKTPADGLLGYLLDEVRAGTLDLGLAGIPHGVEPLLAELTGGRS